MIKHHMILLLTGLFLFPPVAHAQNTVPDLSQALIAAQKNDWETAEQAAAQAGPVAGDLILWQRLRTGIGTADEYDNFMARRADWPGLDLLHQKGEAALAQTGEADRIIRYFAHIPPKTGTGHLALIAALQHQGNPAKAEQMARDIWLEASLSAPQEDFLLQTYPGLADMLKPRFVFLLWAQKNADARRLMVRMPPEWQALGQARLALLAKDETAPTLLVRVPAALQDHPLLAQARLEWLMARKQWKEASALLNTFSTDAQHLERPEEWAKTRARLARQLLQNGQAGLAYQAASRHYLPPSDSAYNDLEFLSGFIALRRLEDAGAALVHFTRLDQNAVTPITVSRAKYWQGRVYEALADSPSANAAFLAAAQHQTAYYGQLAAEKLGMPFDQTLFAPLNGPDWRGQNFTRSSVFQAAQMLVAAGDLPPARRFLGHLAEKLPMEERTALVAYALDQDAPFLALTLSKQAIAQHQLIADGYFPISDLVPDSGISVSRALLLAIARRESEFNPQARSPAGALGLLQLLPETAQRMAKRQDMPYEARYLTDEPHYNARLGSAYLAQMMDEFGTSMALVTSAYNAGPGRPRRWITQMGDPRLPEVDVVDWVEMIPLEETRTYVMRVSEGLTVYRAKLTGQKGPISLISELKGQPNPDMAP